MSQEDYDKFLGAYMKPISDTENVSFVLKNGKTIKGADVLKTKVVSVELTSTGRVSEAHLYQEMEVFIQEVKNESNN